MLNTQGALLQEVNQQVLQNLHAQQSQQEAFQRELTVEIQASLAAPLEENEAIFELPASQGGYLDATPIGVQETVSDLVRSLQATGQPVAAQALLALNLADRALVAGAYKLSYALFKIAYQILQYLGPFGPPFGPAFGIPQGPDQSPPFGPPPSGS